MFKQLFLFTEYRIQLKIQIFNHIVITFFTSGYLKISASDNLQFNCNRFYFMIHINNDSESIASAGHSQSKNATNYLGELYFSFIKIYNNKSISRSTKEALEEKGEQFG